MSKNERAYLCDGYGCDKKCGENFTSEEWKNYACHHTLDEKHAKNKVRRDRKFATEMHNGVLKYIEI